MKTQTQQIRAHIVRHNSITPMEALRRYGWAGRALGIGRAAVNKWPPLVPRPWAAELHILTRGKLRYDPNDYRDTSESRPEVA